MHVYPEATEIGRVFRPALGIAADLNVFADAVAKLKPDGTPWADWTRELRGAARGANARCPTTRAR